jgi:hypothetical protein
MALITAIVFLAYQAWWVLAGMVRRCLLHLPGRHRGADPPAREPAAPCPGVASPAGGRIPALEPRRAVAGRRAAAFDSGAGIRTFSAMSDLRMGGEGVGTPPCWTSPGAARRPAAALARVISIVENQREGFQALCSTSCTGGSGRPSDRDHRVRRAREVHHHGGPDRALPGRGETVGVIAVDPTSPYTGGALLGDRIRMNDVAMDDGVFIRSMATRGRWAAWRRRRGR